MTLPPLGEAVLSEEGVAVRRPRRRWRPRSAAAGLGVVVLLLGAVFYAVAPGFLNSFNLHSLSVSIAIDGMTGLAMMVVIATGGLNLALGAIGVSAAMAMGWANQTVGLPTVPAILVALAAGAAMGAVNGLIVVLTRLHSFIVTLATMSIFFGVMVLASHAQGFNALPTGLGAISDHDLFGAISPLLLVTLAVGSLLGWLYRFTGLGRELLAAGANPEAARLAGLPVGRMFVLAHTLSGLLGAVAGIMVCLRNFAIVPSMAGQLGEDWLLNAFLAPVLGGTLLAGGNVTIIGTLLGAVLIDFILSGLNMVQIGQFWEQSFLGLVLLGAVLFDRARGSFTMARARRAG